MLGLERADEGVARAGLTSDPSAGDGGREAGPAAGWRGVLRRGVELGREHLAVIAIIVLAGCLWTGYSMVQARSEPVAAPAVQEPAGPPSGPASSPPSGPPGAGVSATPAPRLRVHVRGQVKRPGVVSVPEGARVLDAVNAAGGLTAGARPGDLNLAAVVPDGAQIVIGDPSKPGGRVVAGLTGETGGVAAAPAAGAASGTAGTATTKVNLNTATAEQLDTLPGVGPVMVQKILSWRQEHQRFSRVEELQEIDGVGPKTFERLKDQVTLG
ncbi:ComEA family DNA-binding protein [Nigerium massiliense]|uniref:ComEA family DNA-binding protein n=1 Tax=Nigerium massiliense TaxID=1522317 RepID=UPI00069347DF|nr:ComEA family DNA-binding protein [Nigerium massiliense]